MFDVHSEQPGSTCSLLQYAKYWKRAFIACNDSHFSMSSVENRPLRLLAKFDVNQIMEPLLNFEIVLDLIASNKWSPKQNTNENAMRM